MSDTQPLEDLSLLAPKDSRDSRKRTPGDPPTSTKSIAAVAAQVSSRGSLIVVWAILFAVFGALRPHSFLTTGTLESIFSSQQALVFLALAVMTVFIVGEFDLSFAATMALAAIVVPTLVSENHMNVWLACAIGLAAAAVVGGANAYIIVGLKVDPIITTLGMYSLVNGISERISNSTTVTFTSPALERVTNGLLFGLPASFYYGIVVAALLAFILNSTPLGRRMIFVGSNRSVARLAGIRVNRIRVGGYVVCALLSAVGGILLVGTVGSFDPSTTSSYLLPALSATFLGTAIIQPGRFNPVGTVIAIYFLATGIVGLQILGFADWISDAFYGAALIIAITISTRLSSARLLNYSR